MVYPEAPVLMVKGLRETCEEGAALRREQESNTSKSWWFMKNVEDKLSELDVTSAEARALAIVRKFADLSKLQAFRWLRRKRSAAPCCAHFPFGTDYAGALLDTFRPHADVKEIRLVRERVSLQHYQLQSSRLAHAPDERTAHTRVGHTHTHAAFRFLERWLPDLSQQGVPAALDQAEPRLRLCRVPHHGGRATRFGERAEHQRRRRRGVCDTADPRT
eukprot:5649354-Pleurochrysis_carterae.AAC.1